MHLFYGCPRAPFVCTNELYVLDASPLTAQFRSRHVSKLIFGGAYAGISGMNQISTSGIRIHLSDWVE